MKKLFRKELREEMKAALIGIVILTGILVQVYKNCTGHGIGSGEAVQPLMSPALHREAAWFCAVFGAVLGWLQIRAEKHPDLWAFLVHRPMTRTRILGAKIAAGLCLYALAAGLPLLGLLIMVLTPGHVAAPFEWPMTFPLAAIFLLGGVFYFVGMLTGVRQARWYGSRGFGVGPAIFAAMTVFICQEFWQAVLFVAIFGGILALAVWGSFQSVGCYRNQPMPGKLALTAAFVATATLLIGMGIIGLNNLLVPESRSFAWSDYVMTTNGIIYKVSHSQIGDPEIVGLDGKPLLDDKTGRQMKLQEFDRHSAPSQGVLSRFVRQNEWNESYMDNQRFFIPWRVADKTFWYLKRDGCLAGYDGITRRLVATLKPGGNSGGFILPEQPHGNQFNSYVLDQKWILASFTTVYLVDFENRAIQPIFIVTNDDRIGGYNYDSLSQRAVVVTRQAIYLLDFDGRVEWSVPYQPSYPSYPRISVFFLEPTNRFAVEFYPDREANETSGGTMPTRIEWLVSGKGISKILDLPKLPKSTQPNHNNLPVQELACLFLPPAFPIAFAFSGDLERNLIWLAFIPAILCGIVGWQLVRRFSFAARAQMGWVVFLLLFGIPGLLTFLSVQEWPARESCQNCKKLRVVDREKCPHCGADFAPPEKNGTEIFAPLTAD